MGRGALQREPRPEQGIPHSFWLHKNLTHSQEQECWCKFSEFLSGIRSRPSARRLADSALRVFDFAIDLIGGNIYEACRNIGDYAFDNTNQEEGQ
jgi:hypothetical protein